MVVLHSKPLIHGMRSGGLPIVKLFLHCQHFDDHKILKLVYMSAGHAEQCQTICKASEMESCCLCKILREIQVMGLHIITVSNIKRDFKKWGKN